MSSIMRARSAVTGRGEGWDIGGSSLRAEGCWTFNAQDRMPRSSPLTAHPLTASAKNAPAPTPPSRESGFVQGCCQDLRPFQPLSCHHGIVDPVISSKQNGFLEDEGGHLPNFSIGTRAEPLPEGTRCCLSRGGAGRTDAEVGM